VQAANQIRKSPQLACCERLGVILVAFAGGECIPNSTFGTIRISTDSSEEADSKQDADLVRCRKPMRESCANLEMHFGERNEFQVGASDSSSKQMLSSFVRLM
jgi:hypothetical protein